jgi:hypothetical protein
MPRGKPGTFGVCSIDGCDDKAVGRGWCRKHYTRWHQHGDVETVIDQSRGTCTIEGCEQPHKGHGLCQTHYKRQQRFWHYVNVLGPAPRHRPKLGHCWVWTGYISPIHGNGQHAVDGRMVSAYRWAYQRFVGPVPEELELDHLCRNRACVRFSHLEPVTHLENVRRGARDRKQMTGASVLEI